MRASPEALRLVKRDSMNTHRSLAWFLAAFPLALLGGSVASAQYTTVCRTIYEPEQVTAYRLVEETQLLERDVTVMKPVYETEYRERRYRVAKPVVETQMREERRIVLKPYFEEREEDRSYYRTRYVAETQMREERRVVQKPVMETSEREERIVVRRPVTETVMQERSYTCYEPVTTCRPEVVDRGSYVDQVQLTPGATRNRLQWLPRTVYNDPVTGLALRQRAGFYWVPQQAPPTTSVARVYVPNLQTEMRPTTTLEPRTVTQKVPVQVTRYEDEVQVRKVPVQVCRMVSEEQMRQVRVTVQKPVREKVENIVKIRVCKYREEEIVKQTPVTVQRVEYEDRVERIPVRTCKMVAETRTVRVPRTVCRYEPYTYTRMVAKQVLMRVPVDPCGACPAPQTSYYYPGERVEVEGWAPTPAEPRESDDAPSDNTPSDEDPTGKPTLTQKPEAAAPESEPSSKPGDPDLREFGTPPADSDIEEPTPATPMEAEPEGTGPAIEGPDQGGADDFQPVPPVETRVSERVASRR